MKFNKSKKTYITLTIILILFGNNSFAKLPFEKYPAIQYKKINFNEIEDRYVLTAMFSSNISNIDSVKVEFGNNKSDTTLYIYKNNKFVQKFEVNELIDKDLLQESMMVGDLNNDGILDMKIIIDDLNCDWEESLNTRIYLISKSDNTYNLFVFKDYFDLGERDFNNDNLYEIISIDHKRFKNHSYWVFDVFSIANQKVENVSLDFGYPVLIQHLKRENTKVTKNLTKKQMQKFRRLSTSVLTDEN